MKKTKIPLFIFLLSLIPFMGWGSEMASMWTNLYTGSEQLSRKYAIMTQIVQEDDRDLIGLLVEAQGELLGNSRDAKTVNENYFHTQLQLMIIKELGELRAAEGGEVVMRTVNEASNLYLKAESIRTLGKMSASEYVDDVSVILRNLNIGVTRYPSREETETVVLACISALERMKHPDGFEPVFFAANGGYARQIKQVAYESLKKMVEDPSEPLMEIMIGSDDLNVKKKVLDFAVDSSGSPAEGLVMIAAEGLKEGLRHAPDDLTQKILMANLRTVSCSLLIALGYDDPEISASLGEMLEYIPKETKDLNEILTCLAALGAGQNDESVSLLSAHLKKLNDLQRDGITITDQREIKGTIQALGNTGSSLGQAELTRVQFSNWNSAVQREAKAALEKLN